MKDNIIFLDIDGVLNGYNYLSLLGWNISCIFHIQKWYNAHTKNPFSVHEEKVRRLSKIVKKTNAKVVMSSSWRFAFWKVPYEEKDGRQKLLADLLKKYNIEVIGITPRSYNNANRGEEIYSWLSHHQDMVKNFVILDDEDFDIKLFPDHIVKTSKVPRGKMIMGKWYENTGLKWKHVRKAIKILNK